MKNDVVLDCSFLPSGAATATIIPGNANASTINLANLQQIQIQQGTNNINLNTLSTQGGSNINLNSLPTQLQMSIGGVSVPVSLAAALSQSVSGNSSGGPLTYWSIHSFSCFVQFHDFKEYDF